MWMSADRMVDTRSHWGAQTLVLPAARFWGGLWKRLRGLALLLLLCGLASMQAVRAQSVASLSLSPASLIGGLQASGTVFLTGAAPPGGLTVAIGCQPTNGAALNATTPFPANVVVPAGQSSCNFTFVTSTVNAPTLLTLTATIGASSQSASLTLQPANLRLAQVVPLSTLRLQWDQPTSSAFQLRRDGSVIATLPGNTYTFDDAIAGGFVANHTYVYTLGVVSGSTFTPVDMEMVVPGLAAATDNQAVDSRLDLRYSDVHLLDHVFGATSYRGGLFAGYASDPSKVGRSFARFGPLTATPPTVSAWRTGGISAYFTGLAGSAAGSVTVGCQAIAEAGWDYSKLMWSLTDHSITPSAPVLNPGSATNALTLNYDPANPVVGWQTWNLESALRNALSGGLPLSVAWAATNETAQGWAYFAKKEYNANLAPCATWAWTLPYPLSLCIDGSGIPISGGGDVLTVPIVLKMHGVGVNDSVPVTITSPGTGSNLQPTLTSTIMATGLKQRYFVQCNRVAVGESWTITINAICNGVTISTTITQTQQTNCQDTGGINNPPPVGGGAD